MKGICSECGDRKILNRSGVCANRHGCEHRQFQHRARTERLLAEMDRQAWHNDARQAYKRRASFSHWYGMDDAGYDAWSRHPSNRDIPLAGGPEKMNKWVDEWLHRSKDDEE